MVQDYYESLEEVSSHSSVPEASFKLMCRA